MNIQQAVQKRISDLSHEKGITLTTGASAISPETTIETLELICTQLCVSLADFFVNDTFRGLDRSE